MEEKEFLEVTKKFQSIDFINNIEQYNLPAYEQNKLKMLHLACIALHSKGIRSFGFNLYYSTDSEPIFEFHLYTTNNSLIETNRNKGSTHRISNEEHLFRYAGDFWNYFDKVTDTGIPLSKNKDGRFSNYEEIKIKFNKKDMNIEDFLNNSFFKYFIIHYNIAKQIPTKENKSKLKI